METLYDKLKQYSESDYYPFHMPGHKRNSQKLPQLSAYDMDITEIDGFDNLHEAQGIILEAQQRAAQLYGSEETRFLINGSTAGLLAAVCGTVKKGGKLLMARNCHKAVYHAVYLHEIEAVYMYASMEEIPGVNTAISPEQVRQQLQSDPEIEAVLITSPGYEGITSDVSQIAAICHSYSVPLIVDQAHGAHFGLHPYFPEHAVREGADVVIMSLHKTLPSLTQTALIHMNGSLIRKDRIRKYLGIFQTSSPSYVLMAGIDRCIQMITEEGTGLFSQYIEQLEQMRTELSGLKRIHLLDKKSIPAGQAYDFDRSKIVCHIKAADMNGVRLYETLIKDYHLQIEMAAGDYIVAMTSVMDDPEGYGRLVRALKEIDSRTSNRQENLEAIRVPEGGRCHMRICEAEEVAHRYNPVAESSGEIAADYVYLYPPGIPLIVPGEEISDELISLLAHYKSRNMEIHGINRNNMIKIVDKEQISGRRCG